MVEWSEEEGALNSAIGISDGDGNGCACECVLMKRRGMTACRLAQSKLIGQRWPVQQGNEILGTFGYLLFLGCVGCFAGRERIWDFDMAGKTTRNPRGLPVGWLAHRDFLAYYHGILMGADRAQRARR
jgi:hypothetical protein